MTLRPFPQLKDHPTWFPDFVNLLYSKAKRECVPFEVMFGKAIRFFTAVEWMVPGPWMIRFSSCWFHGFQQGCHGHTSGTGTSCMSLMAFRRRNFGLGQNSRPEWWIALNIYRKPCRNLLHQIKETQMPLGDQRAKPPVLSETYQSAIFQNLFAVARATGRCSTLYAMIYDSGWLEPVGM